MQMPGLAPTVLGSVVLLQLCITLRHATTDGALVCCHIGECDIEGICSNFSVPYEAEIKMHAVQVAADAGNLRVQLEYS